MVGYGYNSSKVILGQHLGFENGLWSTRRIISGFKTCSRSA